jgi:membrane fusion protein, multidrug efflux system
MRSCQSTHRLAGVGVAAPAPSDSPVNSIVKYALWTIAGVGVVGALAAPKVLPLLSAPAAEKRTEASGGAAKPRSEGRLVKVSTYRVQPTRFTETITSTGSLIAEEGVELQAEINGKVVAINFREGSRVRRGDLLLKLNDADLRATYERAKYRKELAMLRERRIAQLLKQGVARQEEYDMALNELNVQDAEIELTRAQIAKTEIRAPFDGIVGLRFVSEGAFVNAATRIATLQRLDQLKVDFAVPEKYASRIKIGSPITFMIAGRDSRFRGEIYAFDPRIDMATRTVLIRARYPNPDRRVLPGAFANVVLVLDEVLDAVLVPAVAVVAGLDEKNVYIVLDGKATRRAVETGTRTATTVQVLAGLQPGDLVITSGLQQMREGLAVAVDEGASSEHSRDSSHLARGHEAKSAQAAVAAGRT